MSGFDETARMVKGLILTQQSKTAGLASRVALDDLRVEHVGPDYHSWLNDPDVMRFTEARFRPHTIDNIRSYVEEINASRTDHLAPSFATDDMSETSSLRALTFGIGARICPF